MLVATVRLSKQICTERNVPLAHVCHGLSRPLIAILAQLFTPLSTPPPETACSLSFCRKRICSLRHMVCSLSELNLQEVPPSAAPLFRRARRECCLSTLKLFDVHNSFYNFLKLIICHRHRARYIPLLSVQYACCHTRCSGLFRSGHSDRFISSARLWSDLFCCRRRPRCVQNPKHTETDDSGVFSGSSC